MDEGRPEPWPSGPGWWVSREGAAKARLAGPEPEPPGLLHCLSPLQSRTTMQVSRPKSLFPRVGRANSDECESDNQQPRQCPHGYLLACGEPAERTALGANPGSRHSCHDRHKRNHSTYRLLRQNSQDWSVGEILSRGHRLTPHRRSASFVVEAFAQSPEVVTITE